MSSAPFTNPLSRRIWETKYRFSDADGVAETGVEATWQRVANALARAERRERQDWAARFYHQLEDFRFLPGGRILAGAGTGRQVTLFNCFVMGTLEDSIDGIFSALREGALTMHQGGGVGYDFSPLRPAGMRARHVGSIASGPLSFMRVWDSMCATLLSTGSRRGAMMGTLRCDHPDIEAFIDAKRDRRELRHFNLSVLISDAFMEALAQDNDWPLLFPAEPGDAAENDEIVRLDWPGREGAVPCRVWRRVRAQDLWQRIMRATYDCAEPGVLFIDRINRENNLGYCERISATNPCGEIPLPPYGACNLGSLNLTAFVERPFGKGARLDLEALGDAATVATRMLDNVIDTSRFPLRAQRRQALASRRVGLGLTGLADALVMLGLRYDDEAAVSQAQAAMRTICHAAYRSSIRLAGEKGGFPLFEAEPYLDAPFVRRLPADIRDGIARHGIRNSHLCAIAPAGTISLLANNVSSGLEPVYAASQRRRLLQADGRYRSYELEDYAACVWRDRFGGQALPDALVDAGGVPADDHLNMQAALQPFVDSAVSKTINVAEDCPFDTFAALYRRAYALELKGCTTFRPNPVTGSVLSAQGGEGEAHHCCTPEREAD